VPTLHHPETSALFVYRAAWGPGTPVIPGTAGATGLHRTPFQSTSPPPDGPREPQTLRDRLRQRLAIVLPQVRRRLDAAGRRYKRYADRRAVPYNPDDLVGKRVALRRDVRPNKLTPHGLGVYQVVAASDHTVTIATLQGPVKISKDRILQTFYRNRPIDGGPNLVTPLPGRVPGPDQRPPELLHIGSHDPFQRIVPHVPLVPVSMQVPHARGTQPL
jgi:hypothetical protein